MTSGCRQGDEAAWRFGHGSHYPLVERRSRGRLAIEVVQITVHWGRDSAQGAGGATTWCERYESPGSLCRFCHHWSSDFDRHWLLRRDRVLIYRQPDRVLALFFANFAVSWIAVILVMDGTLRDAQGRQAQLDIEKSGRAGIALREANAIAARAATQP